MVADSTTTGGATAAAPPLGELALRPGDRVRFRRTVGQHWQEAVVEGRERDGSVALRDTKGASRAIRPDQLEVFRVRHRSGRWVQVEEHPWEQLALFTPPISVVEGPRRSRRRGART